LSFAAGRRFGPEEMPCRPRCCPTASSRAPPPANEGIRAQGVEGFLGKVTLGWLGGWLGSAVFGYWPASVKLGSIYIVPALLCSVVGVFGVVLVLKITERKHPAGKQVVTGGKRPDPIRPTDERVG